MNLLFPSSDPKTQKFLRKRLKKQSFGMEGPVGYPGPLYLSDFHFCSSPRRNLPIDLALVNKT